MLAKVEGRVEVERLRIYDFLLLFPYKIKNVKLKKIEKEIRASRNKLKLDKMNPYNQIKEDKKVFDRMKAYQLSALNYLASYDIVDSEELLKNNVLVKNKEKMKETLEHYNFDAEEDVVILNWLFENFAEIPLDGEWGLKARTNLMEYKYDRA